VCRADRRLFALRVADVIETMRPLPLEAAAAALPFVLGISVVRGMPVPVVALGALFGGEPAPPGRIITLRIAGRIVALGVDEIVGVRAIPPQALRALPPLLRDGMGEHVSALSVLDRELFLVLQSGRLVPETAWASLGATP
jgi:purine-binding chemotaxis protein CheW